jgi:type IV pilus assembly protein PilC
VPEFKYTAIDASGVKLRGTVDAMSAVRARNELLSQSLDIVEIKEKKGFRGIEITKKQVKRQDLMNFSRQLAAFLRAGIPILDALTTLTDGVDRSLLRTVLVDIADALRSGAPLSDAMAAHSGAFPNYYVGILRSAELTGNLDSVLDQLADYIERDLEAKRAVKSALTYPLIIVVMAIGTIVVLSTFVLPKFQVFFASFHAKLPLPTRMLLSGAAFVQAWWLAIVATFVLLVSSIFLTLRTERGKFARDRALLAAPVLGEIVQCATIERFFRILGAMLRAGVPVPDAMTAANEGSNNRVYAQALATARAGMLRGEGIADPLATTGLFPRAAEQMLRVGEDTGTLDRQLSLAADFYQSELSHKIKRMTSLFEPAVILIMGAIVGFVAIALVAAMYGIFNQVKVS